MIKIKLDSEYNIKRKTNKKSYILTDVSRTWKSKIKETLQSETSGHNQIWISSCESCEEWTTWTTHEVKQILNMKIRILISLIINKI